MSSRDPFLWLCAVKSLYVQHTLALCVLWQRHFPLTGEGARSDSPRGQESWFAHCFPERGCHSTPSSPCQLSWWLVRIQFFIFFCLHSWSTKCYRSTSLLYCETKFGIDSESVPAQQERSHTDIWDGSIRHWKYLFMCPRKSLPDALSCFKVWACCCISVRRGN